MIKTGCWLLLFLVVLLTPSFQKWQQDLGGQERVWTPPWRSPCLKGVSDFRESLVEGGGSIRMKNVSLLSQCDSSGCALAAWLGFFCLHLTKKGDCNCVCSLGLIPNLSCWQNRGSQGDQELPGNLLWPWRFWQKPVEVTEKKIKCRTCVLPGCNRGLQPWEERFH